MEKSNVCSNWRVSNCRECLCSRHCGAYTAKLIKYRLSVLLGNDESKTTKRKTVDRVDEYYYLLFIPCMTTVKFALRTVA